MLDLVLVETDNAAGPAGIRTVELSAPTSPFLSIASEGGPDELPMLAFGAIWPFA